MILLPSALKYEAGLPTETRIPGFWADAVPFINRIGADPICSFSLSYGSKEPVSVAACYTSTFSGIDRPKGLEYGSRSGTRPTGQDFGDPGVCLRCCTKG